jgi:GH35 family endo-1,4-beta-xylanase
VGATVAPGAGDVPDLPVGRPADLSVLLDDAELAVVAAADARAATLRSRPLRLVVGAPGAQVAVTQTRHGFTFGFPVDFREFANAPDALAFYAGIARAHTTEMVAETSLKWRVVEPSPGNFFFDLADAELAWARDLGFSVKGHTLLWGNAPPFSTGSGIPDWLLAQFPSTPLSAADQEALRGILRRRVETTVDRYRGRIDVWDVTNETLNPFTQWFIARLGPDVVNDLFGWVRALDPGAQLVFNEWITEVFTGLPGPNAAAVRDRVLALRAAGVPVDAIGQQGHFVPGIVYAGGTADLSQRTRIDDYATALDTLAQAGLPIHVTETNVIAPDEPEARAAQTEALMRLWWGHPSVEQIVFWALWNAVAARQQLMSGLWDDAGVLTRPGEAVVSLLNDRWRTHAVATADARGIVELRATYGDYVASWDAGGGPVHVDFRVQRGPGTAVVAVVAPR